MTELKVKITRSLVKRATAIAMAICLVVTMMPASALAKTREDYGVELDYYNSGYYDPETGAGGYYDPANEDGYYNPANKDGYYAPTDIKWTSEVTKLLVGETAQLSAELVAPKGSKVELEMTWESSKPEVATINENGLLTAVSKGNTVITVKAGKLLRNLELKVIEPEVIEPEVVAVESITLDKTALTFDKIGATATLTATVGPDNATDKTVTWSTSDEKVATVVNGKVTAVADGTATITAKAGDKTATATVTVDTFVAVTSVTLDKTELAFDEIGATATLTATVGPDNATDKTVTWSTSNDKVATVEAGKVTAVGNGTATITAKAGDKTATATVTVSQKSNKVAITLDGQTIKGTLKAKVNKSYKLKAVVTPSNVDAKNAVVKWKTSNSKIATVKSNGKVTIKKTGKVTITATTADGKNAKVTFKAVKQAVKVTKLTIKGSKTMKVNSSQTLKVTVNPATVDNKKVTWKSSNKKIATVNSRGKVKAKKKGTVKITVTAKDGSKKKATIKIKVK